MNTMPDNSIDNLKLNKILYFAQGWSLVKLDLPLFQDDFDINDIDISAYFIVKYTMENRHWGSIFC